MKSSFDFGMFSEFRVALKSYKDTKNVGKGQEMLLEAQWQNTKRDNEIVCYSW